MPEDEAEPPIARTSAALTDQQISWGGLLLGRDTRYRWRDLTGWDSLPGVDEGDIARPSRHGAWSGRALAGARVVTWTGLLYEHPDRVGQLVRRLRQATTLPDDESLRPLTIRTMGETLTAQARVSMREIITDLETLAGAGRVTLQWTCPDPRRFSPEEYTRTIMAPIRPDTGLAYPLDYPLDYGPVAIGGSSTLTNAGDTPAHPHIVISGPCDRPLITNRRTGTRLEFDIRLVAGESLVIDCDAGTVTLNGTADRFYTLTPASVPVEYWTLAAGANGISFRPMWAGPGAQLTIRWRDAHL